MIGLLKRLFGIKREEDPMKYLIVGLGNIGEEYAETRHNVGFKIAEAWAEKLKVNFEPSNFGLMAKAKYRGRTIHILKPDTYMNLSGKAVLYWKRKLVVPVNNILVITDDINLSFGQLRLKPKGGNGGHNGLKSIEQELLTAQYPRLRVGVGKEFSEGRQVEYVLGKWSESEKESLSGIAKNAYQAIEKFTYLSLGLVMNEVNKK